jgi:glucosamine 6-phosphate synthetase-like amidotransferase/phosphosugar isomerase protein
MAKEKGAFLYGICNVVGSSIARETHTGCILMLDLRLELLQPKLLAVK